MNLTLRRLTNSAIPPAAESAFVRVWHTGRQINEVRQIKLPAPGTATTMDFTLPADVGYAVGVYAWEGDGGRITLLAGGETHNVTVQANKQNVATVAVKPWEFEFSGPDTLLSGERATLTAKVKSGPNIFTSAEWFYSTNPSALVPNGTIGVHDGISTYTFTSPITNVDTAVYLQINFQLPTTLINPPHRVATSISPFPLLGQLPIRIPLKAPSSQGTLAISFDKRLQVQNLTLASYAK